jgi:hypothetical protein
VKSCLQVFKFIGFDSFYNQNADFSSVKVDKFLTVFYLKQSKNALKLQC